MWMTPIVSGLSIPDLRKFLRKKKNKSGSNSFHRILKKRSKKEFNRYAIWFFILLVSTNILMALTEL
jgi:hypothetical protein